MTHAKKILLILILPLLALVLPAAHAQTITNNWTGTAFTGTDPYYGALVHAYKTGTTATLIVSIQNTFPPGPPVRYMNVTSVIFAPDWGTNTTVTNSPPIRINPGQQGIVTVSITVPATTVATNLVRHSYTVYVTYTTPPPGPAGVQTTSIGPTDDFAVYSVDQAADIALIQQYALTLSSCPSPAFKSSEAVSLCLQAASQLVQGAVLYSTGNFTGAKTLLQNGASLWNQAVSTESSKGASIQQATIQGSQAAIQASQAAVWASYGSLLLGAGALVGAVAALVYALRRFKPPKA
ncbi:MAG TPA: hypothetical protein VFE98_09820 [Candidatus Bathyarchaeia archaeon]|nr:hypothetical protein [Candidatus Bathyarchaeia archaeon]